MQRCRGQGRVVNQSPLQPARKRGEAGAGWRKGDCVVARSRTRKLRGASQERGGTAVEIAPPSPDYRLRCYLIRGAQTWSEGKLIQIKKIGAIACVRPETLVEHGSR